MLFNSYIFIFVFLPITLFGYWACGYIRRDFGLIWLIICSLFFYGWWDPSNLLILLASMAANFHLAKLIGRQDSLKKRKLILTAGIAANLALLGWYKYSFFVSQNIEALFDVDLAFSQVALPLGISFFTFTQIAYLVDVHRRIAHEYNPAHYGLFVTYFPHLIAGPILHHKEMMPQFEEQQALRPSARFVSAGLALFAIGLFKKVVIADSLGAIANPVFMAAEQGYQFSFVEAWIGAMSYSLQLYFDFSGYADMACGLAVMLGIRLPANFNSPYRALSIIDFWRRWHMTLSRFLRDYVYIPLGGNRNGKYRRHINLLLTMLLGGIWHGAGWTFVLWGFLHGICLVMNHAWRELNRRSRLFNHRSMVYKIAAIAITHVVVVIAWVFFRAETFDGAMQIINGLLMQQGLVFPGKYMEDGATWAITLANAGYSFRDLAFYDGNSVIFKLLLLWVFVTLAPNAMQIMASEKVCLNDLGESKIRFGFNPVWMCITVALLFISFVHLNKATEFLYFNF